MPAGSGLPKGSDLAGIDTAATAMSAVAPAATGRRRQLRISETFVSRQGEGLLTGTFSYFIRTSGCNLRCRFCDTPYASWNPEGGLREIDALVAEAAGSGCRHAVLTGGEPLLPRSAGELVAGLRREGLHVTIETAGTVDRELTADLMSISPKLSRSGPEAGDSRWARLHEKRRMRPDVIRRLIDRAVEFQLKFVVETLDDYVEAVSIAAVIGAPPDSVWMMPQAIDTATLDAIGEWLRPKCDRDGFRFSDRMQIRWYGNRRGT